MIEWFEPMLCGKYKEEFAGDAATQNKLDGIRCLKKRGTAWTRNLKPQLEFIQEWLAESLCGIPENIVFDGELMLPLNEFSFQDTLSAVKKKGPLLEKLQYNVYDVRVLNELDMPFKARRLLIQQYVDGKTVCGVETRIVSNDANVQDNLKLYLDQGYEGLIWRALDAPYKSGTASKYLRKLKLFTDSEYQIIQVVEGTKKFAGMPVFVCEVSPGKVFNVVPEGSFEYKRELWAIRDTLVGKLLTVRYQELTKNGIPRFPVGVAIRDYE